MKFIEVEIKEVSARSSKKHSSIYPDLIKFLESDMKMARVEDKSYNNNNNDLRRAIQGIIVRYQLPIKVFMLNGDVYISRNKKH